MLFGTPLDTFALHIVMFAECFLIPAWLFVLGVSILLVRDYFSPQSSTVGGEGMRVHGLVLVLAQPIQYGTLAYNVAFVPFTVMMKLLILLVGRV